MNDLSYKNIHAQTDDAILKFIGKYIHTERLRQNKSQEQVALEAGISRSTLSLLERGEVVKLDSFLQVLRVLNSLHLLEVFQVKEQISPIEYAKIKKKERKQASPRKNKSNDLEW